MAGEDTWYVLRDGVTMGPLTRGTVEAMIRSGEVKPDSMVWPGSGEWITASASTLGSAFSSRGTVPPPPPPMAPQPMYMQPRKSNAVAWRVAIAVIGVAAIIGGWKDIRAGFEHGFGGRSDSTSSPNCNAPNAGPNCGARPNIDPSGPPGPGGGDSELLTREINRFMAQLNITELVRQRASGLSEQQQQDLGRRLAISGLGRLDPDLLAARTRILLRIYNDVGERGCAALARGQDPNGAVASALARYDSATQSTWAEISVRAMAAELNANDRVNPPSQDQIRGVLQAVAGTLSGDQRSRFERVLQQGGSSNDGEVCWYAQTVSDGVLRLQRADRDQALTTLALANAR